MRRSRLWTPKCISAANAVRFLLPNFSQKRTPAAGIKTTHFTIWSPPQQSALKHKKTRMTNKPQKAVNVVRLGARFEAVHFFGDESRAPLVCTHVSTSKTKKAKKKRLQLSLSGGPRSEQAAPAPGVAYNNEKLAYHKYTAPQLRDQVTYIRVIATAAVTMETTIRGGLRIRA